MGTSIGMLLVAMSFVVSEADTMETGLFHIGRCYLLVNDSVTLAKGGKKRHHIVHCISRKNCLYFVRFRFDRTAVLAKVKAS